MADDPYSKVTRRMWSDEGFRSLSALKPSAQALWIYLLTSPRCTSFPGLVAVGALGLAEDLKWPVAATKRCLAEIEAAGMAIVDTTATLIWLPKSVSKHNMPANPSVVIGWCTPWKTIPECPLRARVAQSIRSTLLAEDGRRARDGKPGGLAVAFAVVLGEISLADSGLKVGRRRDGASSEEHSVPSGVPSGVNLQEQEQEPGQNQDPDPPQPPRGGGSRLDGLGADDHGPPTTRSPSGQRNLPLPQVQTTAPPPASIIVGEPPKRERAGKASATADAVHAQRRSARGPSDSERRYAAAYAAGIADVAGEPYPPPLNPLDRRKFVEVLPVCATSGGQPLTGGNLDAWIRSSAATYRRATAHQPEREDGFSVSRWAAWVRSGGMATPCAKLGIFGDTVLDIWGKVYAGSERNYGSYAPSALDARTAADIANDACGKAAVFARDRRLKRKEVVDLVRENIVAWARGYLAINGHNGGTQYADQRHPLAYLLKCAANFGTTWSPGPGANASVFRSFGGARNGASQRGAPAVQRGGLTEDEIRETNDRKGEALAKAMGIEDEEEHDAGS